MDINKIIEEAKKINLEELKSANNDTLEFFKSIILFLKNIENDYFELIEALLTSHVRFCDYYDSESIHGKNITEYFIDSYENSDKTKMLQVFSLYVFLKNVEDLILNFDLCDNIDELFELLDNNYYFEDLNYLFTFIKNQKKLENEDDLLFLENNKYKIFFSGFSYKDIEKLEKHIKKAFLKKLEGQLSNSDIITLAEAIDHVKDLYDIPIFRIQLADDYRIAYLRKNDVTVILGVTLKTGKPIDYTRYDSLAKNINKIYEEVELFKLGVLPQDSQHYKVIEQLDLFNKKIK